MSERDKLRERAREMFVKVYEGVNDERYYHEVLQQVRTEALEQAIEVIRVNGVKGTAIESLLYLIRGNERGGSST